MQVAICDDHAGDLNHLRHLCDLFASEQDVSFDIVEFYDARSLLREGRAEQFDIILLDILLGEDSGTQAAIELRRGGYGGAIVFVTSSTGYYPESYEANAVHYLVKPLLYEPFCEAMIRALRFCGVSREETYIELWVGRQPARIPIERIRYVEVYNHTVVVHTVHQSLPTGTSLKEVEEQLTDERFVRCHRSYLVNVDYIAAIHEDDKLELHNREKLPISRRRRTAIKKAYIRRMCAAL